MERLRRGSQGLRQIYEEEGAMLNRNNDEKLGERMKNCALKHPKGRNKGANSP
jgi:hypothetical protein